MYILLNILGGVPLLNIPLFFSYHTCFASIYPPCELQFSNHVVSLTECFQVQWILLLISHLTFFCFWQVDNTDDPLRVKTEAKRKGAICISAINGEGLEQFCDAVQAELRVSIRSYFKPLVNSIIISKLKFRCLWVQFNCLWQNSMVPVEAFVPYNKGELLNAIHQVGIIDGTVSLNLYWKNYPSIWSFMFWNTPVITIFCVIVEKTHLVT